MDRHDRVDHHNYHEQHPNYHHYQHHHFHQQQHHPPAPPQAPPLPQPQPYPQQHQHFHHYPPPANQNHFPDQQNHDFQFNHQNHDFYPNNNHNYQHQQMGGEPIEPFGGGGFRSGPRKRDCIDGGSTAKLYVAPLPRTATEEDIRHLFQEHGNIAEVIFPKDKRSGQRQGYCFLKYTSVEEADRAIRALNGQHAIPGEMAPIKVRYADGERERLGGIVDKLYVGCINKQASKEEIEEIFTPYGHVEDIFIARDELKQSRGFAFVKFSQRDMALAAIKMLHGNFIMRDCDQPLVVRFADPKKPRTGELRGNYGPGGPNFGPCFQEPVASQSVPNFGDCMGGFPDASYSMQHYSTKSQPQEALSHLKQELAPPCLTEPPLSLVKQLPPELSSVPLQHAQAPEECIQSSQQAISEMQDQTQNSEQQQVLQIPVPETAGVGSKSNTVSSISTVSAEPSSPEKVDLQECDWSEHSCPDGYKYYYNCITCESRWQKPEELALFQKSLQKRQKLHNGNQQPHSILPVFSCEENVQTQTNLDPIQIQPEKSRIVDSACI